MKERVTLTLTKEAYEKLEDLANMFNVSKSVIVERCINYIYDNDLEGEMFLLKSKKKKKNTSAGDEKVIRKDKMKEEEISDKNNKNEFILKL